MCHNTNIIILLKKAYKDNDLVTGVFKMYLEVLLTFYRPTWNMISFSHVAMVSAGCAMHKRPQWSEGPQWSEEPMAASSPFSFRV